MPAHRNAFVSLAALLLANACADSGSHSSDKPARIPQMTNNDDVEVTSANDGLGYLLTTFALQSTLSGMRKIELSEAGKILATTNTGSHELGDLPPRVVHLMADRLRTLGKVPPGEVNGRYRFKEGDRLFDVSFTLFGAAHPSSVVLTSIVPADR
jgi:hypothetical protein